MVSPKDQRIGSAKAAQLIGVNLKRWIWQNF